MNYLPTTGDHLIALLNSPIQEINEYAIKQMLNSIHFQWIYFYDSINLLKQKYNMYPDLRVQCAFLISQINFYGEQLEEAVEWALKSGDLFDINQRNIYTDSLISIIIQKYINMRSIDQLPEEEQKLFDKYEQIVVEVLDSSFKMNIEFDRKLLIGLAIETGKTNFIEGFIKDLPNNDLTKFFKFINKTIQTYSNKNEIYEIFLKELSKKDTKNYEIISECYFNLKDYQKHAQLLLKLFNSNVELCYQQALDIQETGNINYINQIANILEKELGEENFKELKVLLNGEFREQINSQFLSQNNNVDYYFLKELGKRWKVKDSVSNNSFILMFAFALVGTKDISLYKEFKEKFEKIKYWSLYTTVGTLGLIYKRQQNFIEPIRELKFDETDDYYKGGLEYANGLSNFGIQMSDESLQNKLKVLSNKSLKEGILHGTVMNIGLRNVLTNNNEIVEQLTPHLFGEKANFGEATGYAIGLIKATNFDKELVELLINTSRNNPHDRIARSMMISLGLLALGNRYDVMPYYESLIQEKDSILRMGAVNMLTLAFFDTSKNDIISKLLQLAATDLSNDVRRSAVIGIAFVMYSQRKKAMALMKMLAKSYNEFVRHGVALALGIMGAHKFDQSLNKLLQQLWEDKCFHVKQAVAISFGLLHQLGTETLDSKMMEIRNNMKSKIESKYESSMTKLGCYLGFGLMHPGGCNSILSLVSESGHLILKNIICTYMFSFYWYWMPLTAMLGLALEPTYLVGVVKNLKVPRSFQFLSKASPKYFAYFKTPRVIEEVNKKGPVILSTTKKVRARKDQHIQKPQMQIEEEKKPEIKEEKQKEEPQSVLLDNPSRVLMIQKKKISFDVEGQRYKVAMKNRKKGIVFVIDKTPDELEVYTNDLPSERYLIPPKPFTFDEKDNKQQFV